MCVIWNGVFGSKWLSLGLLEGFCCRRLNLFLFVIMIWYYGFYFFGLLDLGMSIMGLFCLFKLVMREVWKMIGSYCFFYVFVVWVILIIVWLCVWGENVCSSYWVYLWYGVGFVCILLCCRGSCGFVLMWCYCYFEWYGGVSVFWELLLWVIYILLVFVLV